MTGVTYARMEVLRTLRNRFFLFFSLGFPLILFYIIGGPNSSEDDFQGTGLNAAVYYMVSLAAFGAMNAMVSSGSRIALERDAGWTRQLRISPLTSGAYFGAKLVTGFICAIATILLLFVAGLTLGVDLSAGEYLKTVLLMLIALIPIAALGIWMGHVLSADSTGPAIGGGTALLALLSGTWFPITDGFIRQLGELLPSWWLVQASRNAIGAESWPLKAWVVLAVWTVVLTALARRAYMRDSGR
jgi:ABC-2 type transport system permease protein